jgi:hypothetical protein
MLEKELQIVERVDTAVPIVRLVRYLKAAFKCQSLMQTATTTKHSFHDLDSFNRRFLICQGKTRHSTSPSYRDFYKRQPCAFDLGQQPPQGDGSFRMRKHESLR